MATIYVFSIVIEGKEGPCYAMAEDGTVLGSHYCSGEQWAKYDLGIVEGSRPDRHVAYAKHYPAGYEMEFVPAAELDNHEGFRRAYAANQRLVAPQGAEEGRGHDSVSTVGATQS